MPRPAAWRRLRGVALVLGIALMALLPGLTGCGDADEPTSAAGRGTTALAAEAPPHATTALAAEAPGDASADRGVAAPSRDDRPAIVFLGTSLTAGYGLEESQAFPALIQQRVDAAGLEYRVVNAGVSGDTSAGGLRRLAWLLRLPVAVLVLELGANDMLRGQGIDALRTNLEAILDRTRTAHPDVRFVIAGMRAAPNLGRPYVERFDAIYPELAEHYQAALIPFLLEDVAARRSLNQADGIHPTAEGHALIADRVWQSLAPLLR